LFLYSTGPAVGQMVLPSKMFSFLKLSGINKDGSTTVFGGTLYISMISYQSVKGFGLVKNDKQLRKPVAADKFCIPVPSSGQQDY
jgi:hypothetical protein